LPEDVEEGDILDFQIKKIMEKKKMIKKIKELIEQLKDENK